MRLIYRPWSDPKDSREQHLIEELDERGKVVRQYRVYGSEEYAQGHIRDEIERVKRAPIRYRPNGAI